LPYYRFVPTSESLPNLPAAGVLLRWVEQAVETMQLGVTITDVEGRIVYSNPADARMHGYEPPELIGKHVAVFATEGKRRQLSRDELRRLTGWNREGLNRRQDGTVFSVWLFSDVIRDARGEPVGIVTTCEDISERRRIEETLRESAMAYRTLVEHATQGICRIGGDGRFIIVNPALVRMLDYDNEPELLEVDVPMRVYGAPDQAETMRAQVAAEGRLEVWETVWKQKDGSPLAVRLSGRVLGNPAGGLEGFELIVEDASERRILEDQLRQAQKMETMGQLTGGIAHDFNNILTVILANTDLILAGDAGAWHEVQGAVEEVRSAARRGSALIRQLMAFSRHEGLTPETLDVAAHLEHYQDVLRRVVPESIDVHLEAEAGVPPARVDARGFEQVLLNLVTNARDAMPEGGTLRIQVSRAWIDQGFRIAHGWGAPGEYVAVVVSDTGIGMSEELRRRMFEPFFTTKPPGIGTGLGMAMAYAVMKQHRGFVHVYSEPGQGTAVKLWFPVATGALPEQLQAAEPRVLAVGGTETILVVEDEAPIRRAAQRVLERHGYHVRLAADGEEGLVAFRTAPEAIDLILSDLVMPRMSGRELYRRVRETNHAVPFLFASGYTRSDAEAAQNLGDGMPFIQKPWSMGELLRRVREVLDTRAPKGAVDSGGSGGG
jgi:two-component system cell cycle sensor histidine kinase/response regulator CckA